MKDDYVIFHNGAPCHVWLQYYHIKGVVRGSWPKLIVCYCSGCDTEMLSFFRLQLLLQMSAVTLKTEESIQCSGLTPAHHPCAPRWKQFLPHSGSQKLSAWLSFFLCHRRPNAGHRTACGDSSSAPFSPWGHLHCGALAQISCVAL